MPAFGGETLGAAGRRRRGRSSTASALALTTDSYVVKPLRFPGGSIGELAVNGTVNDLAVSGARPLALSALAGARGGPAGRRAARPRSRRSPGPPARPASRSSPATPRWSSAATPTACTCAPPASAVRDPRAHARRRRACGRATGSCSRAAIGDHGTAIMLARGEFELDAEIESDTRSLWPAVDALLDAAGPQLRCLRDATRGGVASVLNELARASAVAMLVREERGAGDAGGGGRGGDPGDRPDVRRQRGQAGRVRRARRRRTRRSRRCARCRAARRRPRSARCAPSRPGWCWWRRASAGGG